VSEDGAPRTAAPLDADARRFLDVYGVYVRLSGRRRRVNRRRVIAAYLARTSGLAVAREARERGVASAEKARRADGRRPPGGGGYHRLDDGVGGCSAFVPPTGNERRPMLMYRARAGGWGVGQA